MVRDRRSIRAGYRILLFAMAIQGLTPDHGSLASSWLLRLVTTGWPGDRAADGDPGPMLRPAPGGEHDAVPGGISSDLAAVSSLRARMDFRERLCIHIIPIGLLEQASRSVPRLACPTGVVWRRADGLIPSLCRFLC